MIDVRRGESAQRCPVVRTEGPDCAAGLGDREDRACPTHRPRLQVEVVGCEEGRDGSGGERELNHGARPAARKDSIAIQRREDRLRVAASQGLGQRPPRLDPSIARLDQADLAAVRLADQNAGVHHHRDCDLDALRSAPQQRSGPQIKRGQRSVAAPAADQHCVPRHGKVPGALGQPRAPEHLPGVHLQAGQFRTVLRDDQAALAHDDGRARPGAARNIPALRPVAGIETDQTRASLMDDDVLSGHGRPGRATGLMKISLPHRLPEHVLISAVAHRRREFPRERSSRTTSPASPTRLRHSPGRRDVSPRGPPLRQICRGARVLTRCTGISQALLRAHPQFDERGGRLASAGRS